MRMCSNLLLGVVLLVASSQHDRGIPRMLAGVDAASIWDSVPSISQLNLPFRAHETSTVENSSGQQTAGVSQTARSAVEAPDRTNKTLKVANNVKEFTGAESRREAAVIEALDFPLDELVTGVDTALNREVEPFGHAEHNDDLMQLRNGSVNFERGNKTLDETLTIQSESELDSTSTVDQENSRADLVASLRNMQLKIKLDNFGYMPEEHQRHMSLTDFRDAKLLHGEIDCYLCALAELTSKLKILLKDGATPNDVRELQGEFKRLKAHAIALPKPGRRNQLLKFLRTKLEKLPANTEYRFALVWPGEYQMRPEVVAERVWLDDTNKLKTAMTNYSTLSVINDEFARVTMGPPDYVKEISIVEFNINNYDYSPKSRELPGCSRMCRRPEEHSAGIGKRLAASGGDSKLLATKIGIMELLEPNNLGGPARVCPWCVVAVFAGSTVGGIKEATAVNLGNLSQAANVQQVVEVFKLIGYPETRILLSVESGSSEDNLEQKFHKYLEKNLPKERHSSTKVVLAYEPRDGSLGAAGVNLVMLSAWRATNGGKVQLLIVDYRFAAKDMRRFKRSLAELEGGGARALHLIQPKRVTHARERSFSPSVPIPSGERIDQLRGTGCRQKSRRLIGYLAAWSSSPLSLKRASRFTNLIFAFAQMNADASLELAPTTVSKQRLAELLAARAALSSELRLSVAIGGWTNSEHFSKVIGDRGGKRRTFIGNIKKLLSGAEGFDGVDIDWEYPGTGGATEGKAEDRANYVEFVRELRESLPAGKLISIAAAAGEEAQRGFDIAELVKYVDWIGVMTYDFNGAWDSKWGASVGPNAPLAHAAPEGYSGKLNANWAIKQYACRSSGAPEKIILGLPFYGRYWSRTKPGKAPDTHPLFREAEPVDGKHGGEISYRDIESTWFLNPTRNVSKHWDERSSTPWALDEQSTSVLTYDSSKSIALKVKYALEHGLGGVMVWSVEQDDDELTLTKEIGKMCAAPSGGALQQFKCNPLGEERRWWTQAENRTNAGMCGKNAPLYKGYYAHCNPDDPGYSCCSGAGYCGSGDAFCSCPGCVDYGNNPGELVREPTKPTVAMISWHVGFNNDTLRPGMPRCGPNAPLLNGQQAICNPDDDHSHCCSRAGFCGTGAEYCDCARCKDYRKSRATDSGADSSRREEEEEDDQGARPQSVHAEGT